MHMIRKLIVIVLAIIGISAILYFGTDWIQAGLSNLQSKATQYYQDIQKVPEKINDITNKIKT